MSETSEPQVSWKAIERNAAVEPVDGSDAGRVVEVAGDPTADVFSGLVVKVGFLDTKRFLPAEHVTRIWPHRVRVDLTAAEIESLPPYQEPVVERLPRESFFTRLRRLFR